MGKPTQEDVSQALKTLLDGCEYSSQATISALRDLTPSEITVLMSAVSEQAEVVFSEGKEADSPETQLLIGQVARALSRILFPCADAKMLELSATRNFDMQAAIDTLQDELESEVKEAQTYGVAPDSLARLNAFIISAGILSGVYHKRDQQDRDHRLLGVAALLRHVSLAMSTEEIFDIGPDGSSGKTP
jgi:hypothetical protein